MKKSLIALVVALALFLLIVLAGGVITIGDKLGAASPVLAWVFYALLLAARAVVKNLCEDEEGLIVTDGKERADNMTRLVRAINQQAETRMRLSGIMDQAEQEKIALLWRKQELDEKKEAQDQAEGKEGVTIKLDDEAGALSV